jgi:hypothetical protein
MNTMTQTTLLQKELKLIAIRTYVCYTEFIHADRFYIGRRLWEDNHNYHSQCCVEGGI